MLLNHFIELRRRLLQVVCFFLGFFILCFYYSAELFHLVVQPLLNALPVHDTLIATQLTSPMVIPITLAIDVAMISSAPYALFHAWRFMAPGLYPMERQTLRLTMVSSLVLFSMGVLFCFYVVLPLILSWLIQAAPLGIRLMPDMAYAVDFMLRLLLVFGLSFQVPLICLLLVRLRLLPVSSLKVIRPYLIVAAFTLGMLLTPPDLLSQILLAVPLCLLYELGILLAVVFGRDCDILKEV